MSQKKKIPIPEYDELLTGLRDLKDNFYAYLDTHQNYNSDAYFDDGRRHIDFVIVYKHEENKERKQILQLFFDALQDKGFELEKGVPIRFKHLKFVKIYAPEKLLIYYSNIYNIKLNANKKYFYPLDDITKKKKIFHTLLTYNYPKDPDYNRIMLVYDDAKRREYLTTTERILIVYEILDKMEFGGEKAFRMIDLLKNKILETGYGIHDGPYQWVIDEALNQRQLLKKFWGRLKLFYKVQPIELIYTYYGEDVAYFYAFLELLSKMLIYAAAGGITVTLFGLITAESNLNYPSHEICKSEWIICPACKYPSLCHYDNVRDSCDRSWTSYVLTNNPATYLYAIFICIWASLFLQLWKRKQNTLAYMWKIEPSEVIINRPEFNKKAKHKRIAKYTGDHIFYVPTFTRTMKIIQSFTFTCLAGLLAVIALFAMACIKVGLFTIFNMEDSYLISPVYEKTIRECIVSFIHLGLLFIFEKIFKIISKLLTDLENPCTQLEYDKSYIYKCFCLCFINAYLYIYYRALIQNNFTSNPFKLEIFVGLHLLSIDLCGLEGCILAVTIELVILILGQSIFKSIYYLLKPYFLRYKYRKFKVEDGTKVPLWEETYSDMPSERGFLFHTQLEIVILYGYLILFSPVFPLISLYLLIFFIFFLRFRAYSLVKLHRRPIPMQYTSFVAWNSVLQNLTYIGFVSTAFLLTFTTNLVPNFMYWWSIGGHEEGFLMSSMSKFAIRHFKDFETFPDLKTDKDNQICYYQGRRYPPDYIDPYTYTGDYYIEITTKFIFLLFLQAFIFCCYLTIKWLLPSVPAMIEELREVSKVKEFYDRQQKLGKDFKGTKEA